MSGAERLDRARAPDLDRAADLMRSDPAGAEALVREVLATDPDWPEARLVLATTQRLQGRKDDALAILEPLAAEAPDVWLVQAELGQVLFALGRTRAAAGPLARGVTLNPDWALGWRLLGDIRFFAGDRAGGRAADDGYLRAIIKPAPLLAATAAIAGGRLDEAEAELARLLASAPQSAPLHHLVGEVMMRRDRLPDAEGAFSQALRLAPDFDLARLSLASVLEQMGKCAEALGHLDRLLVKIPGSVRCRILKSWVLTEAGDVEGAVQIVETLIGDMPELPGGWGAYADGLRALGRTDEAIAAYHKVLQLDPARTDAWWSLSDLKRYRFSPEERRTMEALLQEPALRPANRVDLHFALGKAREDEQDWDGAFSEYAKGNAIGFELRKGRVVGIGGAVQRSKALFTPGFFADRQGWGARANDPIFVVGMPRSGSTLVEQILASHPAVEGTRELTDIPLIVDFLSGLDREAYPDVLASKPRELLTKLGGDYLEWTRAFRRLGRARFVDKSPINFLHVGLIRLMLPNAKIIDVRRHPLDCCVSAFRHHFAAGWEATYDLVELGRFYADYVDLMTHWDAVLPGWVHRVIYEDLVADTEGQVRALLAFLGLPFDEACLRFFENPRAVATPSAEQVRSPISAGAIGYWRNFEPHLEPLRAALGPVLAAYPAAL
jgi:predicted Zn-dependent protease